MGDSSLITILSVVPLLAIGAAIAAAGIAWLSGRRAIRPTVAILLVVAGIASHHEKIILGMHRELDRYLKS